LSNHIFLCSSLAPNPEQTGVCDGIFKFHLETRRNSSVFVHRNLSPATASGCVKLDTADYLPVLPNHFFPRVCEALRVTTANNELISFQFPSVWRHVGDCLSAAAAKRRNYGRQCGHLVGDRRRHSTEPQTAMSTRPTHRLQAEHAVDERVERAVSERQQFGG